MQSTQVVIVGAGPAGLMSALLLARYGLAVTLIERHPGTSVHPKARGLNVRTMEILRSLGLEAPVQRAGEPLARNKYMLFVESLAGNEVRRIADDDLMMQGEALGQYTPCTWTQCAQDVLEQLLVEQARSAGADLQFHSELVRFEQNDTSVRCQIRDCDSGEEHELRADYLLACDGANSGVRRALGIALEGRAEIERFINVYFRADLKRYVEGRWFGICFVENPAVQGLFLPVDNDSRWLFNVQLKQGALPDELTPPDCERLIRSAIGDESAAVEILSALSWTASALTVPRLRVDRVFLVGDAGHIMPPAGGFGLNLAVQDAHNLAWKLAHVLQGKAEPALLDSFEQERLPVAKAVVGYAEQEMDAPHPWEHGEGEPDRQERPNGAPQQQEGSNPWEASLEEQLQAVIGFQYRSDAVSPGPALEGLGLHGQPGTRFPHAWLGPNHSTLDMLPNEYALLVPSPRTEPVTSSPHRVIELPRTTWQTLFGQSGCEAVLVRPDGIVAGSVSLDETPSSDAGKAVSAVS